MTETTKSAVRTPENEQLAEELVERARDEEVDRVGPGGLLTGLTKNVLKAGLDAAMTEHLGYDKQALLVDRGLGGSSRVLRVL